MPKKGYKQTIAHRKKLSNLRKGENNPFFDKKHSNEFKRMRKGKHMSPATEFKKGHKSLWKGKKRPSYNGKGNPCWRGGKTMQNGYILIFKSNHPYCNKAGYVFEHRLVMEKYLGRYLKPEEVVHHINGNPSDNRIKNFILFKNLSEHFKYHKTQLPNDIQ